MSAAMQLGNCGRPVFDVAGLAVSRLNDCEFMRMTGAVPQTINYAVRGTLSAACLA
jgi:hypothetical protein